MNNIDVNDIYTIKDKIDKIIKDINLGKNFKELLELKRLHDKGIQGKNIKIGIIDVNFKDGHGSQTYDILKQVAPDSNIIKFEFTDKGNVNTVIDIVDNLQKCIDNDVRLINISLAINKLNTNMNKEYEAAIKSLEKKCKEAEEKGIIIVASAGNNGYTEENQVDYPGAFNSTICVGSVNKNNEWSKFSNVNEYIDFVTYAEQIELSTGKKVDGTSFAAPVVSGIIALMLQQRKDLKKIDVVSILKQNAIDLGTIGKDKAYGYGLIKAVEVPEDYTLIKEKPFVGCKNFLKDQFKVEELFEKEIYGSGVKIGILGYGCSDLEDFNIKEFKNVSHDAKGENIIEFGGSEDYANAIISPVLSKSIGLCPKSENYVIKDRSAYGGLRNTDSNKVYQLYKTIDLDIAIVMPYFNPEGLKYLADKGVICIMPCFDNTNQRVDGLKGQNTGNFYALTVGQINPDMTLDNNAYFCEKTDCVAFGYGYEYNTSSGVKIADDKTLVGQLPKATAAAVQVAGIVALLKQQNPNLKTANDIRKLLPTICKKLPFAKDKVGCGLIQAKLL